MSVYVDQVYVHPASRGTQAHRVGSRYGHRWCHLLGDSEEELHAFATSIGMKREWFDPRDGVGFHYNLVPPKRELALRRGAVEIDRRGVAGLLRRQRAARAA